MFVVEIYKIEREICDPLYKYIYLTKIENDVVDSREFQRLDRLHQTPSAHFVFPNATHTRKSHSLGVMYLADLSLKRLFYRQSVKLREQIPSLFFNQFVLGDVEHLDNLDEDDLRDDKEFVEILETFRIAALCHDIGHGPFSHIFEDACKVLNNEGKCREFNHEEMSAKIIQERLQDKIQAPINNDDVINLLLGKNDNLKYITSIIDGPYDVDKIDYVSRDAYHTGALEYGGIDFIRIIDGFRVLDGKLLISSDSLSSIMNSFTATQYMYTSVYYHKTVRIFDFMLFEAMKKIPDFLNEIINGINRFIEIDDHNFILSVKERLGQNDDENDYRGAYELLQDIINRKKKYENVFQYRLTLDVSSYKDTRLDQLGERLEEDYRDLNVKVDYTAKVKPIRVDTIKFYEWMEEDMIYDESSHQAVNLSDVSLASYDFLKKMQVLFNIYIDKQIASDHKYKNRIDELCRTAKDRLVRIQRV